MFVKPVHVGAVANQRGIDAIGAANVDNGWRRHSPSPAISVNQVGKVGQRQLRDTIPKPLERYEIVTGVRCGIDVIQ